MNPFYRTIRTIFRPILRLYNRLEAVGLEHVPRDGPSIVVANHHSYLDPFVLGAVYPRKIRFMVKKAQFEVRGTGWFYWGMDAFAVNQDGRDMESLREAMRTLADGEVLGIYPNGTRHDRAGTGEWQSGFAMLARRSGAPVVPAAIQGTYQAHPRGSRIAKPRKVRVIFGPAVRFDHGPGKAGLEAFSRDLRSRVQRMLDSGRPAEVGAESLGAGGA